MSSYLEQYFESNTCTLCSEKKHLHFLPYLPHYCVDFDLHKNCNEYTTSSRFCQWKSRYSLRPTTYLWCHNYYKFMFIKNLYLIFDTLMTFCFIHAADTDTHIWGPFRRRWRLWRWQACGDRGRQVPDGMMSRQCTGLDIAWTSRCMSTCCRSVVQDSVDSSARGLSPPPTKI